MAAVLFGLVPLFQAREIDLAAAMKSESGSVIGARFGSDHRGDRHWRRNRYAADEPDGDLFYMTIVATALVWFRPGARCEPIRR